MSIHERHEPTDSLPAVVAEARHYRTRPEFIWRPGFERCPRCQRFWPSADFRDDKGTLHQARVRERCRDCRRGLSRHDRDLAASSGICTARGCHEPVTEHLTESNKCDAHAATSAEFHARRAEANAARTYTPALARRNRAHNGNTPTPGP